MTKEQKQRKRERDHRRCAQKVAAKLIKSMAAFSIEQVDIYIKYKGKKPLTDTEQALFVATHSYLKDEVKEAEQIRKSVYSILRQEQRPRRAQDKER